MTHTSTRAPLAAAAVPAGDTHSSAEARRRAGPEAIRAEPRVAGALLPGPREEGDDLALETPPVRRAIRAPRGG